MKKKFIPLEVNNKSDINLDKPVEVLINGILSKYSMTETNDELVYKIQNEINILIELLLATKHLDFRPIIKVEKCNDCIEVNFYEEE